MSKRFIGIGIFAIALVCGSAFAQNLVVNGSFEEPLAQTNDWPSYFGTEAVTGWVRINNNGGLNNNLTGDAADGQRNPFHGGGRPIPDGNQVYFVQGTGNVHLTQAIQGMEDGSYYLLIFYVGIRPGNPGMDLDVTLGGVELFPQTLFTNNTGPYERIEIAFQYTVDEFGENPVLSFNSSYAQDTGADTTILYDHVQIRKPVLAADIAGPGLVAQGNNITFTANLSEVTGDASYQWFYNGVELQGETGSSLELMDVVIEDSGVYSVEVTDAAGTTTAAFTLIVVESLPVSSALIIAMLAVMLIAAGAFTLRRVKA